MLTFPEQNAKLQAYIFKGSGASGHTLGFTGQAFQREENMRNKVQQSEGNK